MSTTADCPFCDLSEHILKDTEHAQAFLSNPRKAPGHFLVSPKRHVEKPWELTADERKEIFDLIFFIEQKLIGNLGDGCDIRQNYRPFMQQSKLTVNHVHFHVLPRYKEDYIYQVAEKYETDLFSELDPKEADEVAKLLKD
ncbi:MAG TPA: HIT family protein [Candidatus Saccharimonadales bacterium]